MEWNKYLSQQPSWQNFLSHQQARKQDTKFGTTFFTLPSTTVWQLSRQENPLKGSKKEQQQQQRKSMKLEHKKKANAVERNMCSFAKHKVDGQNERFSRHGIPMEWNKYVIQQPFWQNLLSHQQARIQLLLAPAHPHHVNKQTKKNCLTCWISWPSPI